MNPEPSMWLPAPRSTVADDVDKLFNFLNWMSLIMFLLLIGAAGYWVWTYRRKEGDENKLSSPTFHSTAVEIFWSVGPMLVCVALFHFGVKGYLDHRVAPAGSMDIRVKARKWAWEFHYPNGKVRNDLLVPVGKPVRLVMTSQDVIHSFFVPDFRIKQDVVPGRYSTVWFQATHEGVDQIFCTEYCGLSHSDMLAKVNVVSEKAFNDEINKNPYEGMSPLAIGTKLFEGKACNTCHSTDGSTKIGPSFKGLFGKTETLTDGSTIPVDENYIRESVLVPAAKVVKGFQPVMPPFQGSLNDEEMAGIIAFIKEQK
jgi:cytochrome c oxidase subunit II